MSQVPELASLLPQVVSLAERAGRAILDIYEAPESLQTSYKEDNSPLTRADLASHQLLSEALHALTPHIPLLSEESSAAPYEERQQWPLFWMIDPLDGTKEFVSRNGEFTVNIALIEAGTPILGVVGIPVKKQAYFAARGVGAFRQDATKEALQIHTEEYQGGTLRVVASRSHAGPDTEALLTRLRTRYGEVEALSIGSAIKLCLVADGTAHLYPRLGPTMEWDTAAAQCVVEQAGGLVTDLSGSPLVYNKPDLQNPFFIVSGSASLDWR